MIFAYKATHNSEKNQRTPEIYLHIRVLVQSLIFTSPREHTVLVQL